MQRHNVTVKTNNGQLRDYSPDKALMLYRLFKHLYEKMHHKAVLIANDSRYRSELMDTANYFHNKSVEIQQHIFGDNVGTFEIDETKIESA